MSPSVFLPVDGDAIGLVAAGEVGHVDDEAKVARLFDTHHQRLYRLARRLAASAEEARDLVQETFLRVARAPRSVPPGLPHEEAWLVRVLVNIARDEWRKQSVRRDHRARIVSSATTQERASSPEAALVAGRTVWAALARLTPRRRAVIVLYELEDVPMSEIARLLGVSTVTVRWHLSRGRRELADVIAGKGRP